jgi:hypothetical protein
MASILGELEVTHGGATYRLRLTMRGIATLQDEFGNDIGGILDMSEGGIPNMNICLRVVELALKRFHPDADADLADDILSDDMSIFGKLIAAAFPSAAEVQPDQAGAQGRGKNRKAAKG